MYWSGWRPDKYLEDVASSCFYSLVHERYIPLPCLPLRVLPHLLPSYVNFEYNLLRSIEESEPNRTWRDFDLSLCRYLIINPPIWFSLILIQLHVSTYGLLFEEFTSRFLHCPAPEALHKYPCPSFVFFTWYLRCTLSYWCYCPCEDAEAWPDGTRSNSFL